MSEQTLVTAKVIVDAVGIPRATLYRLVDAKKIPAYPATKPWHQRRHFLFSLPEVRAALAAMQRAAS
jgi:hypothetical protein